MNRKIIAGVAAGILTAATLLIVGAGAYRAGQRSEQTIEVVGEVATTGEGSGRTVVVPVDGWHDGWHGPGPGLLLFPLIVIGLVLLFATRRGGWRGPHHYADDELREWHRRQHGDPPATPAS